MNHNHFYCPNPICIMHKSPEKDFYRRDGYNVSKTKKIQRYKCKKCSRTFTFRTFELDFRFRRRDLFEDIFHCSTQGMSNRAIARKLKMSETSIRNRLKHLSRQAILKWEELEEGSKITEDVSYDGFETFVYSQYDPNNINQLIGSKSHYLYNFNYSHLNRKGRMTQIQKKKLEQIQKKHGRYPSNCIFSQTKKIFSALNDRLEEQQILHTDEHKSYEKALRDLTSVKFIHNKTNSKDYRGSKNPLFPVNHMDMKLRHFLKSCTRETIAFNKNEMGLMDRYILHGVQTNFLRPKFLKHGKNKQTKSPAMHIGILDRILEFKEFFDVRKTKLQVNIREEWQGFYQRIINHTRFSISPYLGP